MAKQKNKTENVFFQQKCFHLNEKHLQVLQVFSLLKNTKETSGETEKT